MKIMPAGSPKIQLIMDIVGLIGDILYLFGRKSGGFKGSDYILRYFVVILTYGGAY